MECKNITWDKIHYIWENHLWVNRISHIKEMSSMVYLKPDNYDMEIYHNYSPTFIGLYDGNKLVGVNSGHRTTDDHYRSRGLYISNEYRGNNLANMLLLATSEQAIKEGCKYVWSYPRETSIKAYTNMGFKITSTYMDGDEPFGPNCYVLKDLCIDGDNNK